MFVNLIVLCYNNLLITKKFMENLCENTDRNSFRLIMINNGSTDGTKEYLDSFKNEYIDFSREDNLIIYNSDSNLGVISGRNKGYEIYKNTKNISENDMICFLDNDQMPQRNWLENHVEFLIKNKYDAIGVESWIMDNSFFPKRIAKKGEPFSYIGAGGLLTYTKIIDSVDGLFDENFNPAYFEDPDFSFRCLEKNYKIGCNFDAKIQHIPHSTLSSMKDKGNFFKKSYSHFCKKWGNKKIKLQRN